MPPSFSCFLQGTSHRSSLFLPLRLGSCLSGLTIFTVFGLSRSRRLKVPPLSPTCGRGLSDPIDSHLPCSQSCSRTAADGPAGSPLWLLSSLPSPVTPGFFLTLASSLAPPTISPSTSRWRPCTGKGGGQQLRPFRIHSALSPSRPPDTPSSLPRLCTVFTQRSSLCPCSPHLKYFRGQRVYGNDF